MNARERHLQLAKKIEAIKKEMQHIYNTTKVKVKAGDVVESLDFGCGKPFMYFVFHDSWKKELCYVQISDGGSNGYNQVHDGYLHGTLVTTNGYEYALKKLELEGACDVVINSFIRMVHEPERHKRHTCLHKRYCHWCGQRLTADLAN